MQYLSASCPRQLIDLNNKEAAGSSDGGSGQLDSPRGTPVQSTSTVSPTATPAGDMNMDGRKMPGVGNLRRFKVLLMEVENLWMLLLDCENHQRQLLAAPEDAKSVFNSHRRHVTK